MALPHKAIVFPDIDRRDWEDPADKEEASTAFTRWVKKPGRYERAWNRICEDWREDVRLYEANPNDFYAAYHYLDNHPAFWSCMKGTREGLPQNHVSNLEHTCGIYHSVSIDVVKVNPETECIEDEEELNTETRIWYETGKRDLTPDDGDSLCACWHDINLDGGADTYEKAIIGCARKIWERYGNDRRICDAES